MPASSESSRFVCGPEPSGSSKWYCASDRPSGACSPAARPRARRAALKNSSRASLSSCSAEEVGVRWVATRADVSSALVVSLMNWQLFLERLEDGVGARLAERVRVVVAGRYGDRRAAHGVRGLDIARRVAHD